MSGRVGRAHASSGLQFWALVRSVEGKRVRLSHVLDGSLAGRLGRQDWDQGFSVPEVFPRIDPPVERRDGSPDGCRLRWELGGEEAQGQPEVSPCPVLIIH